MFKNPTFYPTPKHLITKMWSKVQGKPRRALEPSAGKGDLICGHTWGRDRVDFSAIETDPDLQATLRGKHIKVIDSDFLSFAGPDKFDLIIANPPFDEGDKHLLKAIEIMYSGEIVFLLNAETLRNPHTNTRKLLVRKLVELDADIEYIKDAFLVAERKTAVEIALVYIKIKRNVEEDLFADCDDHATRAYETAPDLNEVSRGKTISDMVAEYNQTIKVGTEVIVSYYRNYRKVGKYLSLNEKPDGYGHPHGDLTEKVQSMLNDFLKSIREDYWKKALSLDEVTERLTKAKREAFYDALEDRCHMDFTESNIRQFVMNIIRGHERTLIDAVVNLFDMFTIRHAYRNTPEEKNIHYFNGWKTNDAFKVKKRLVIPIYGGMVGPFRNWSGHLDLDYRAAETLRDFDLVMSYFDGMRGYRSLPQSIKDSFSMGETKGESTYFKFRTYKKGTIHLEFKDMDILRRFNVAACRGKGWLPQDYGAKEYAKLQAEEMAVVDSFEGSASYDKNLNRSLFASSSMRLLTERLQ